MCTHSHTHTHTRTHRECVNSLQTLLLPDKAVGIAQQLAFNVRTLCADTLFYRASRGMHPIFGGCQHYSGVS